MPIGPDEIVGYAVALMTAAAGGGYGVAKLQSRSSASSERENCEDTCSALDRVSEQIQGLSRRFDGTERLLHSLVRDVDGIKFQVDHEVKPQLRVLHERLEGLESRALPNRPKGPI